jgi:hypothetical protein
MVKGSRLVHGEEYLCQWTWGSSTFGVKCGRKGSICFALLGYLRVNGLQRTRSGSTAVFNTALLELDLAANPRSVSFIDITGQPK